MNKIKKFLHKTTIFCIIIFVFVSVLCAACTPKKTTETINSSEQEIETGSEINPEPDSEKNCSNGHTFEKNVCTVCGYTQTDFSEFTKEQRIMFAKELSALSVGSVNDEIIDSYVQLIRLQQDSIEEYEKEVSQSEKALEEAENNRTIRVYDSTTGGFIWIADKKIVNQCKENLTEAQNRFKQANEDMNYDISYFEINCYVYSLNNIIEILTSDTNIDNCEVKNILAITSLKYASAFTHHKEIPTEQPWKEAIISDIKLKTGIDLSNQ